MYPAKRLLYLSYLMFFFFGCSLIAQGILIIYIAKTYNISIATVGFLFFIPAIIEAILNYINGHTIHKANLKKQIIIAYILIIVSILLITTTHFLFLFLISLVLLGISYGFIITIPNYIIIALYNHKKFEKLNILNFTFSLGGVIGPIFLGLLLKHHFSWQFSILLSLSLVIFTLIFTISIPFSVIPLPHANEKKLQSSKNLQWPLIVYLIAISMMLYVFSESIVSIWIVSYVKFLYHVNIESASLLLMIFWLFITFGRLATNKISKNMKISTFITIFSLIATFAFLLIFFIQNYYILYILIAIMGIGYASLYAAILSYGMDQLSYISSKLMTILVICGTAGGIIALPISSFFVKEFGYKSALLVSLISMICLVIIIVITVILKNKKLST